MQEDRLTTGNNEDTLLEEGMSGQTLREEHCTNRGIVTLKASVGPFDHQDTSYSRNAEEF